MYAIWMNVSYTFTLDLKAISAWLYSYRKKHNWINVPSKIFFFKGTKFFWNKRNWFSSLEIFHPKWSWKCSLHQKFGKLLRSFNYLFNTEKATNRLDIPLWYLLKCFNFSCYVVPSVSDFEWTYHMLRCKRKTY